MKNINKIIQLFVCTFLFLFVSFRAKAFEEGNSSKSFHVIIRNVELPINTLPIMYNHMFLISCLVHSIEETKIWIRATYPDCKDVEKGYTYLLTRPRYYEDEKIAIFNILFGFESPTCPIKSVSPTVETGNTVDGQVMCQVSEFYDPFENWSPPKIWE